MSKYNDVHVYYANIHMQCDIQYKLYYTQCNIIDLLPSGEFLIEFMYIVQAYKRYKRWPFTGVKGQREKVQVSQPLMIANYVTGMGGVDMLDRFLSA